MGFCNRYCCVGRAGRWVGWSGVHVMGAHGLVGGGQVADDVVAGGCVPPHDRGGVTSPPDSVPSGSGGRGPHQSARVTRVQLAAANRWFAFTFSFPAPRAAGPRP